MQDKTFVQAMDELQQRAFKEMSDEVVSCWIKIQQGATVNNATTHIKNERMREAVTQLLLYMLLQSLLFEARERQMISGIRFEELKRYVDVLVNVVKQQPLMLPPLATK